MRAKAIVTVTLEIRSSSVWGPDCPIGQIVKQAKDDILCTLRTDGGLVRSLANDEIRLTGDPLITRVIVTEE
jgi:hypothetical protein